MLHTHKMLRGGGWLCLSATLIALCGCKPQPRVTRLLCEPVTQFQSKVALEIEELEGADTKARLLDTITLEPVTPNPFVDAYVSPTIINLSEATKGVFWLLDRQTGKLTRNRPWIEYYCGSGRRF